MGDSGVKKIQKETKNMFLTRRSIFAITADQVSQKKSARRAEGTTTADKRRQKKVRKSVRRTETSTAADKISQKKSARRAERTTAEEDERSQKKSARRAERTTAEGRAVQLWLAVVDFTIVFDETSPYCHYFDLFQLIVNSGGVTLAAAHSDDITPSRSYCTHKCSCHFS